MRMNCGKCQSVETEKDLLATCDNCGHRLCQSCAKLSATEHRAVTMKKRVIIYWCLECQPAALPNLGSAILRNFKVDIERSVSDLVHNEILKLTEFIGNSREENIELPNQPKSSMDDDKWNTSMKQIELVRSEIFKLSETVSNLKDSNIDLVRLCQPEVVVDKSVHQTELHRKVQQLEQQLSELRCVLEGLAGSGGAFSPGRGSPRGRVDEGLTGSSMHRSISKKHTSTNPRQPVFQRNAIKENQTYVNTRPSDSRRLLDGKLPSLKRVTDNPADTSALKSRKPGSIVGTRKMENSKLSAAVIAPKTSVFVGRLSLDSTEDAVKEYLESSFPDQQFAAEKLQVRSGQYHSYRIEMGADLLEAVLNPSLWPEGVIVKKYRFFRGRRPVA